MYSDDRSAESGSWKALGEDRSICVSKESVQANGNCVSLWLAEGDRKVGKGQLEMYTKLGRLDSGRQWGTGESL